MSKDNIINKKVLVSGADYFSVVEINPYESASSQPNIDLAKHEHSFIVNSLKTAGIEVIQLQPPLNCQDGIYTANWGLCFDKKVILSSLPNLRQAEEPYAKKALLSLGYEVINPPYKFSGQGDALICGEYLFLGSEYRTDKRMFSFLNELLDYKVIQLETIPILDELNQAKINPLTGWKDSYFYDLDLALGVITTNLIVWCPKAFTLKSQEKIRALDLDKIEISFDEAVTGFGCNLVSTGQTVIMSAAAPVLQNKLADLGFKTITPTIKELRKGGGYIRCCCLSLT